MLVGVISDTHDSLAQVRKAAALFRELGVGLVVHLGDVISPFTLRELISASGARVEGVLGNNDGERLGLMKIADMYGASFSDHPRTIAIGNRRILLTHGFGDPATTREIVESLAESKRWDAVLYGHTHEADITYRRGVLLLNPGDGGGTLREPSVAVVETHSMRARVIRL